MTKSKEHLRNLIKWEKQIENLIIENEKEQERVKNAKKELMELMKKNPEKFEKIRKEIEAKKLNPSRRDQK